MPLQDLTPQLRTRLNRVEKVVGWFVILATVLLLAGFAYYLYATAARKGWFVTKVRYCTGVNTAAGLKQGDAVMLMGFPVGEVTEIIPNPPFASHGVTVFFWIKDPHYGYIWIDSKVRVAPSDFLGNRFLEITKGRIGAATVITNAQGHWLVLNREKVREEFKELLKDMKGDDAASQATNELTRLIKASPDYYTNIAQAKPYWLEPMESPALADRLETLVSTVEVALPNILNLTNQLSAVLTNASSAVARVNETVAEAHPIVTNLAVITDHLRDPNGSLGNWLIPTNLHARLDQTLATANATLQAAHDTLDNTDTNLTKLATDLDQSLEHLSGLTSNLNWQVQMNTNLVTAISSAIVDTDDLVQGLKRHWLLRSAFKKKATNHVEKTSPPRTK